MAKAQVGDTVKVSYTGTLADGTVFDKSPDQEPLQFQIGQHQLIPGFEQAVIDMEVGQKKSVSIDPEQAYGAYDENAVITTTRSVLPDNLTPSVGQRLQAQDREGNPLLVTITEVTNATVTLDANHPLAGKELTFEIALQEIVEK